MTHFKIEEGDMYGQGGRTDEEGSHHGLLQVPSSSSLQL